MPIPQGSYIMHRIALVQTPKTVGESEVEERREEPEPVIYGTFDN